MGSAIILMLFAALFAPLPLCVWRERRPGARLAAEVEDWLRSRHGE